MNTILTFDILNSFKEIAHFCTTRDGGVSMGSFSSFNVSPFSGDSTENFNRNLQILSQKTEIPTDSFIFPLQTHADKTLIIDSEFLMLGSEEKANALKGIDALITAEQNICIGVTTADCVPLLLFDHKQKVIAAVHAGWRGTCARLVQKTLNEMQLNFGTNPMDVFVLIGPSISSEVYEVGRELTKNFAEAGFPVNKIFTERADKLFLDLWEANRFLLLESGIPDAQIGISGICSFSSHENFFSARRLGIKSGRMYSGIVLKKF